MCLCIQAWVSAYIELCHLLVGFGPAFFVLGVHRSPGKQVGGVAASETWLDVKHRRVSPAGGVVVGACVGVGGAGFVLDELEEGLHVGAQPGDDPGPHCHHRLLVAGLQGL